MNSNDPFFSAFHEMHNQMRKHMESMSKLMSFPMELTKQSLTQVHNANMHRKPNFYYHETRSMYRNNNDKPQFKRVSRIISDGKEKVEITDNDQKKVFERDLRYAKQYKLLRS